MRVAKDVDVKRAASSGLRSFSGSVARTGNSRGLRLDGAFFKAAPEFGTVGNKVRAELIGPGTFLVRIDTVQQEEAADPVIGAWLSFIDEDIRSNPSGLVPFQEVELTALERLVANVSVDDDYELPEDVTF